MKPMPSNYSKLDILAGKFAALSSYLPTTAHEKFLKEEALRFISIAGTVSTTFPDVATNIDERILSHILLRSVIENFFKIIYIFDDPSKSATRFDQILNGFRRDYGKLYNDILPPLQNQIEPAQTGWSSLPKAPDLNTMLAQVQNTFGAKLKYLYFIYRIGSFDAHGNSLNSLFESVFAKKCNFPFLQTSPVIELMSDYYLCALACRLPK